jgi:hypothetical protein
MAPISEVTDILLAFNDRLDSVLLLLFFFGRRDEPCPHVLHAFGVIVGRNLPQLLVMGAPEAGDEIPS